MTKKTRSLNPCFNGRYSLRAVTLQNQEVADGLNPCFNGRYSLRLLKAFPDMLGKSLNPCFNGRYSLRQSASSQSVSQNVS